ncbi:uncharacterized protein ATC70_001927 [Mucor velutinosus]|uniref:Uncharacterized protein n=1 Tax=Mucor velutinosus TaxID=708070 RepID=A0AAN7DD41_9FUNG|nr:hypothetical protein ATC70_001927 [Mucor velutinosus]
MVFNNATTTRWKEDDSNKWTEVVSKKKQYQQQQQQLQQQLQLQQQQQQQQQHGVDDPFAGMKSCVDYEQEIERLKQLVPKVPADSQHKKRPSLEKKFNTNTNTNTTSNTATSTTTTSNHTNNNHNFLNNEFINTNNTTSTIASPTSTTTSASNATNNPTSTASTISRSNSPDTTHSSDSDVSSVLSDHQIVTEEEKLRFLAFVRSWTGDWRKGAMMDDLTSSSNSLWADQSPWSRRHNVQSQQYYSYQQPTMLNKHGQQPIGMGRKTHHHQQSFGYAL